MILRSKSTAALLALLIASTVHAAGDTSPRNLGQHIPANAHTAFWVPDISTARESSLQNSFFQLLADPDHGVGSGTDAVAETLSRIPVSASDPLAALWVLLLPEIGFSIATGIESATSVFHFTAEDIVETFTGSLAIYSTLYRLYAENGVDIVEWDVILAAEYKEEDRQKVDSFLEDSLKRVPGVASRRMTSYHGQDVYQIRYYLEEQVGLPGDPNFDMDVLREFEVIVEYAYVDGVFLLAEGSGEPLRRAIGALIGDTTTPRLHESPRYRRAARNHGEPSGQYHIFSDFSHHIRQKENVRSHADSLRLFQILGLVHAGPLLADLTVDEKRARIDLTIAAPESSDGVFSLLNSFPENTLENLRYVPSDAKTFGSLSFDLNSAYAFALNVTRQINPAIAMAMDISLQSLQVQFQIRAREDIFPHVRGEMITYMRQTATPGPVGDTTRLVNGWYIPFSGSSETVDQVNQAVRGLSQGDIRLLDAEESNIDGITLWSLQPPQVRSSAPTDPAVSFAVSPAGAISGDDPAEARALLRRLQGNAPADIRSNETIAALLDQVPETRLVGFVYTNGEALVDEIMLQARQFRTANLPPEERLRATFGDSWWTLQARDTGLRFRFTIENPQ